MVTLYLVRHGQTDYSLANRFCGSIDPPLNTTGVKMAEALAARYGLEKWAAIYASPRRRAIETAQPTAARAGLQIRNEDGLREIAYGEWEGRAESEIEAADQERFRAWTAHPGKVAPPGGETAAQIAERALAVVDAIRARHSDGKVLVVSHKATLRVLVCALIGIDVDQFRARVAQKVCAVSTLELRKTGPMLTTLGDTSHLPAELLVGDGS